MSGDWNPFDGGTPVNKEIENFSDNIKANVQGEILDPTNEFLDYVTPDITMDVQGDLEEFGDYITPDITIGEEDQAKLWSIADKAAGWFGGATAGVQGQNYVERKQAVASGTMPANNFTAPEPVNKNILIATAGGLGILFYFLRKKKKRK